MTVILILLVPATPDVLSAETQVAVVGIETVQGSVDVIVIESVVEPDLKLSVALSTTNDGVGGVGGFGSASGLLQAIRYKETAKTKYKKGFFLSLIRTDFSDENIKMKL